MTKSWYDEESITLHQKPGRMFKKARSPVRSLLGRARSSKAAGPLARGAYTAVREHDKGARTLLADFFNIRLVVKYLE